MKSPPTASRPSGSAFNARTWPSSLGLNEEIHSPVEARNAARYACATLRDPSWLRTVVKLPPTYMTSPTWAKACTSVASSPVPPAPVPVTPHDCGSDLLRATGSTVTAGVPPSGTAANDRSDWRSRGRT